MKTDPYLRGLDSILIFIKHFLSVLKISETFAFFLRTSSEYLTRYGQGSVFKICFSISLNIYLMLLRQKTKVLDILNTDKNMKIYIKKSPAEVWIRIHFHNW